jgi:hypothetical protein
MRQISKLYRDLGLSVHLSQLRVPRDPRPYRRTMKVTAMNCVDDEGNSNELSGGRIRLEARLAVSMCV